MMTTLSELNVFSPTVRDTPLRCVVCQRRFDFGAGETATVLRHIAYGYDFAHPGACLAAALEWIFVEPGYDRPAFSVGRERVRVLRTARSNGGAAIRHETPEQRLAGSAVTLETLHCWALVEHGDGSHRVEEIIRDPEWQDEPGAAEFPDASHAGGVSSDDAVGSERLTPARQAQPTALNQVAALV